MGSHGATPSDLIVDPASPGFGAEPDARLTNASVAIPVLRGHRVALLAEGDDIVRALIAEADAARHTIHLEFYIWSEGGLVDEFIAALIRAAGRGVNVRALRRRCEAAARNPGLTAWRARQKWRRFAENAAGVMSPLL